MKTIRKRSLLCRWGVAGLSLACCAVALTACGGAEPQLESSDVEQPPDVKVLWEPELDADPRSADAVIDGDELFVAESSAKRGADRMTDLVVFDLDTGEKLWETTEVRHTWLAEDSVVMELGSDVVRVVDRASGEKRFEIEPEEFGSVAATADGIAVMHEVDDAAELTVYDPDSGDERWSVKVEGADSVDDAHVSAPWESRNVHGGKNFSETPSLRVVQDSPMVFAYVRDARNEGHYVPYAVTDGDLGDEIQVHSASSSSEEGVLPGTEFMTVSDQGNVVALIGRDRCKSVYAIVDDEMWEAGAFDVHGGETCENVGVTKNFVDDMVYGLSESGLPQLIDINTGDVVWTGPEQGTPFAVVNGIAVYGRDGYVKAVDIETNEPRWDWDHGSMQPRPAYPREFDESQPDNVYGTNGDVILFGTPHSTFAINADDGEPLWSHLGSMVDIGSEYVVLRPDLSGDNLRVAAVDRG